MGKKQVLYRDKVGQIIQKGDLVLVSTVIGLNGEFRVRRGTNKELFVGTKPLRNLYPATLRVIQTAQREQKCALSTMSQNSKSTNAREASDVI